MVEQILTGLLGPQRRLRRIPQLRQVEERLRLVVAVLVVHQIDRQEGDDGVLILPGDSVDVPEGVVRLAEHAVVGRSRPVD
ncbi:MAG: hypothetical protein ACK55I_10545, partial [bacterium]